MTLCKKSFILLVVLPIFLLHVAYCCELYKFVQIDGPLALQGHVLKTITRPYKPLCWNDCVWLSWCFSLNVKETNGGMVVCELNNSSKNANPNKMATREGWSYHQMAGCNQPECKRKEDLGNGWHRYGDAAIKLFTEKKKWADARSHCQLLGGDLLSITSSHENDFVNDVFLEQLNLSYFREDYPDFGSPYQAWRLNQSEPTVKLMGTQGDTLYKVINGEKSLYFSGRRGYAHIPDVNVDPDEFTIVFWINAVNDNNEAYIHSVRLLNQPLNFESPAKIIDYYFKSGSDYLYVEIPEDGVVKEYLSFRYDQWTHIGVSGKKSSKLIRYVINGMTEISWTGNAFPSITGNENILMGVKHQSDFSNGRTFHGYLKHLLVINKALDIHKIQTVTFWNKHGAWIGLNDQANTGIMSWSDGTLVGKFQPFPGYKPKPSLSERKCTVIGEQGKWFDKSCNMEYPYICEKRLHD